MSQNEGYIALIEENALADGKMKLVTYEGTPVLFIKQGGELYVIGDRCPHMGCRLSGGELEGCVVVCPCHAWRFNLNSGDCEQSPTYKLTMYPFKIDDSKVWVNLEEE